ncbi:MAG: biotin/lipoate A/B protein ligase family protein [Thermoguttaceae bacterium]
MRYLDLTLPTAAENLALDEALLEEAEAGSGCACAETLRLWEARQSVVVVGRSSQIAAEVNGEACRELDIAVLRRTSGGAAVVAGPGCLMYALVLSLELRPALRTVGLAHSFVLEMLAAALRPLAAGISRRGTSDLAVAERKVSGNSLRVKRRHLLYHGTLLYDFPLELIGRVLLMPPRQPGYRLRRPHDAFVANLPVPAEAIRRALAAMWKADEPYPDWPRARTAALAAEKYSRRQWNQQR